MTIAFNEAPQGPRNLSERLDRITRRIAKQRQVNSDELAKQGYTQEVIEEFEAEAGANIAPTETERDAKIGRRQPYRGSSTNRIIEKAQLSLFELEQRGRFTQYPITPSSEFPSILARIPIFVPGLRTSQNKLLDKDNALRFKTPWGTGRKHGPPLSVYEEDTLIALAMLRQKRLIGKGSKLPVPISDILQSGESVNVDVLFTTLSEIEDLCGNTRSGHNLKARLAAIKRLAGTRLEFERMADDKVPKGTTISILDVAWEKWDREAVLYIQFSPVMARWLEKAHSFINWNVRMKLTAPGKAIHRFLSSQPKHYQIGVEKLRSTIGYPRDIKYFLRDLRETLRRLEELGWLVDSWLEGNGRSKPYKLAIQRK